MTSTIVFGIFGFMTMIIGILAQAIPHGEPKE
jgi:predicted secreted protein